MVRPPLGPTGYSTRPIFGSIKDLKVVHKIAKKFEVHISTTCSSCSKLILVHNLFFDMFTQVKEDGRFKLMTHAL